MKDISLSRYVYFALCDLSDVSDSLNSILSRLDDDSVKALISDIAKDIDSAYCKLQNLSL